MGCSNVQFVDPVVTLAKYEEELNKFSSSKKHYREQGVFLLEQDYPKLYFGFAAPTLRPVPIVFAVCIDFTNYDIEPLSIKFVHPVSFQPQTMEQMPYKFLRKLENGTHMELLQAEQDRKPFLCIPGVREYHEHPFHTGNSWFLYRNTHEGSLCFLLDNLQLYGTQPITYFSFQVNINTPGILLVPNPEKVSL